MARSEEEIQKDLIESIEASDETLDTSQGPIKDVFIVPQAGQLAIASQEAEDLRLLFTINFPSSATENEIRNALANYGSTPGAGKKARHTQHFMRFTRPNQDIEIPAGTLVANADGSRVYRVLTTGRILAASADSFFNSARNAYEIGLLVEATGVGPEYNLPRLRINTLLTTVRGIDSTENRSTSSGGLDVEDTTSQSTRLKNALLGINLGAPGGIATQIQDTFPETVTDVAVIQPYEKEFRRLVTRPALDVYSIGQTIDTFTQTEDDVVTGQTQIFLTKVPVTSVTSVQVNGVNVNYTLVNDSNVETKLSQVSQDSVVLDTPLIAGDIVVVTYQYNRLLEDIESDVLGDGTARLFNTDILVRSPFVVNPIIVGTVRKLASFTETEVQENIDEFLSSEFNFTTFVETVFPEVFRQEFITSVSGVQSFTLTGFRRNTGALSDIEPLVFGRNEISQLDTSFIDISIVS